MRNTLSVGLPLGLLAMPTLVAAALVAAPAPNRQTDTIRTSKGELRLTPLFHGSVMLEFGGTVIHVDPWSQADYTGLPLADMIVITHTHGDHLDRSMIDTLKKPVTVIVSTPAVVDTLNCAPACGDVETVADTEQKTVKGIGFEGVPMYNIVQGPAPGKPFHPQRGRKRLRPDVRRDACVRFGRHGVHARNEGAEGRHHRLSGDEPAPNDVVRQVDREWTHAAERFPRGHGVLG